MELGHSGFGQSSGKVRAEFGQSLGKVWAKFGQSLGKVWAKFGQSSGRVRAKFGQRLGKVRAKLMSSLDLKASVDLLLWRWFFSTAFHECDIMMLYNDVLHSFVTISPK